MQHFESQARSPIQHNTTIGAEVTELTSQERQDLVLWSGMPSRQAVKKLLEQMLVEARDEAVLIPPHEKDKRLAALDVAHAMGQVIIKLDEKINFLVGEFKGEINRKVNEEELATQEKFEEIIMSQITGH
jgi:hypothetical protein